MGGKNVAKCGSKCRDGKPARCEGSSQNRSKILRISEALAGGPAKIRVHEAKILVFS